MDQVSTSEGLKSEVVDYNMEPKEMKTLPSMLFEESSVDDNIKNEDFDVDVEGTQVDGDLKAEMDAPSPEGRLEIDLKEEGEDENQI